MKRLYLIVLVFNFNLYASESIKKTMPFNQCKQSIIESQSQFGSNHIVISNTSILYMAKTITSDADILFTCIKANDELIITKTIK